MKKEHTDQMIAHSLQEDPDECCGILTGRDDVVSKVYRITNIASADKRYKLYLMDPQGILNVTLESERSGEGILAFYHSHTHTHAYPSPTDVRDALNGYHGDDAFYILVSLEKKDDPVIRAFHILEDGEIVEEELEVTH